MSPSGKNPFKSSNGTRDPESGRLGRKKTLVHRNRSRTEHNPYPHRYDVNSNRKSYSTGVLPNRDNPIGLKTQQIDDDDESELSDMSAPTINPEKEPLTGKHINSASSKSSEEEKTHIPFWKIYCYIITFWAPSSVLKLFGMKTHARQYAWREKIGLISIILVIGAIIAFLTFGFTRSVCIHTADRMPIHDLSTGYVVINGRAYNLDSSSHPAAPGIDAGANVLYPPINAGAKDASLLFQNVNGNCKGLIGPRDNCTIPNNDGDLAWYMPCKLMNVDGSSKPNFTTDYYSGYACHTSPKARKAYYSLKAFGDISYRWDDVANKSRNLVVYNGNVIDMDILNWLQTDDITYPKLFDRIKNDKLMKGYDISRMLSNPSERRAAQCLVEIARVGVVDSSTVGCIAAQIVLYMSLVFVLALVIVQFVVACYFKWFVSPLQGVSKSTIKDMNKQDRNTDDWCEGSAAESMALNNNCFANSNASYNNQPLSNNDYQPKYLTMTGETYILSNKKHSRSRSTLTASSINNLSDNSRYDTLDPSLVSNNVVKQPPISWEPFGYPLIHIMCLVTCYSEGEHEIRTTFDSVATTNYPNSHKLIMVICDGLITGAGNVKSTPQTCLDMMSDLTTPKEQVVPHSYVSVAQGTKRHNMAKVYAGYYKYDDSTVAPENQQKVPMILVVKCGTPAEAASAAKPGNRGKRDSQIILMSFLESITYNERMTELEFEMLKSIWQVTGLMATLYEALLMVDADTLVHPDSVTQLAAELVRDPEVMGLCGETKIANKTQSWVTAIQVFEYYISHHQAKAFESVFGSVTCLPGCFCMYRIKSPKALNVWAPILANADIVARYSDNVLDSLHKKNLLLLGEDRYLSSLMLRTFPRRKQIFVPKAVCKTVVPDKFKVLLSQRRRWINSTVHNLMELAMVKDLCGTFCFSMQFVIIIQLIGTLVLPASITFTLYIVLVAIISPIKPIMSLVLMAIVFGLPAVLIVVTITSPMYIIWMLIYLISLPLWNFVLPAYAYWKFDDFSWGDTRKTQGQQKEKLASEENGKFDGSQIVKMTWREYEKKRIGQDDFRKIEEVYNPSYITH